MKPLWTKFIKHFRRDKPSSLLCKQQKLKIIHTGSVHKQSKTENDKVTSVLLWRRCQQTKLSDTLKIIHILKKTILCSVAKLWAQTAIHVKHKQTKPYDQPLFTIHRKLCRQTVLCWIHEKKEATHLLHSDKLWVQWFLLAMYTVQSVTVKEYSCQYFCRKSEPCQIHKMKT